MGHIAFGDLATWLASIGTVGTLLFTVVGLAHERRQKEREKRQEQADHISAWVAKEVDGKAWLAILNQSKDPIYEVVLSVVSFYEADLATGKHTPQAYRDYLSVVPPGGKSYGCVEDDYGGKTFHPAVEIAFKDVSGYFWLRRGDGTLIQISQPPVDYYRVALPVPWQLPEQQLP